ncbi:MAG: ankyrin repeat domain-containing protein [Gammaproteobacteria bacterium]|nr:ankyrin repeat domain-containing protein [Gammaproteobacteria bacterium]
MRTADLRRAVGLLATGLLMAGMLVSPSAYADATSAVATTRGDPDLVLAARFGQRDTVRLLLDQGVTPDSRDGLGRTALIAAAGEKDQAITALLIDRGADVSATDSEGATALMHAASNGQLDNLRLLFAAGADVNALDRGGETALSAAVRFGRVSIVEYLLASGADPNHYDPGAGHEGYSPLMRAVARDLSAADSLAMVQLLLARGAVPDTVRAKGETAYTLARRSGKTGVAEILLEAGARDETPYADLGAEQALLKAVRRGDADKVGRLLALEVDPNYRDPVTGVTPLASAAYRGENSLMDLLIEHGADVNDVPWGLSAQRIDASSVPQNERDLLRAVARGDTALLTAIRRGDADGVWTLLDRGADIRLPNRDGDAPGIAAARAGDLNIMRALLTKGLDPDQSDPPLARGYMITTLVNSGTPPPPLVEAARYGQADMLGLLLEAGAAPDVRDGQGRGALHWATEGGHAAAVDVLLAYGADANIAARSGGTPLVLAVHGGQEAIARALLEHGAVLDAIEDVPAAALDAVHRNSHAEAARLLTAATHE